jgi:hypothetical protein
MIVMKMAGISIIETGGAIAIRRWQIEYDVVHIRTSLVQLFALFQLNFKEVVQIIELRRFGGAHNGYPFAVLIEK